MEQTKLDRLLISEISGVDDPANQVPGWMVAKAAAEKAGSNPESFVAKIKGIVLGAPGKDIDMEKDELVTLLAERDEALVKSLGEAVAEAVAKSVAPAEGAAEDGKDAGSKDEPVIALTAEDVQKAVEEVITEQVTKQYNDIFEKVLDRLEGVEKALGIVAKSSLDGQEDGEGEPVEKSTPKLADAIEAAFSRPSR